jgi:hypothetical protein
MSDNKKMDSRPLTQARITTTYNVRDIQIHKRCVNYYLIHLHTITDDGQESILRTIDSPELFQLALDALTEIMDVKVINRKIIVNKPEAPDS